MNTHKETPFAHHTCINWRIADSAWTDLKGQVTSQQLLNALRNSPRLIANKVRDLAREYRADNPNATSEEVVDYIVNVIRETDT